MPLIHNTTNHTVRVSGRLAWNIPAGETVHIGETVDLPIGCEIVTPKKAAKAAKVKANVKTEAKKSDKGA